MIEVLSIGDAHHEREALQHVSANHQVKFLSKSIKLLERPTIEELKRQHETIVDKLDIFLSSSVPVDVFYANGGEFSDYDTSRPCTIPLRRLKRIRGLRFNSPSRPSFSRE